MGLYRRAKIYWFSIMAEGKRIQKSTETKNKKLAERIYAKALNDIQEGKWFENQKARTITFSELWIKYSEKYQKQRDPYTIKSLMP